MLHKKPHQTHPLTFQRQNVVSGQKGTHQTPLTLSENCRKMRKKVCDI
jgi:hypothetical protein